jgi:hypothetical protein
MTGRLFAVLMVVVVVVEHAQDLGSVSVLNSILTSTSFSYIMLPNGFHISHLVLNTSTEDCRIKTPL